MIRISIMTGADIAFALEMTDIEKWGYLQDDFRRLICFEPGGCFVAWKGDRRVGMITTTSYDDYAFLGCLIVPEEQRGQGIGESLMKHAVNYLQNRGVKTIELDGVFAAAPLYRRLGFRDKYLSLRFKRSAGKEAGDVPARSPISVDEIIAFDRRMTGLNRERVIS
jgi:ribosomal protein S18 acetylase RimI-like enzyme